MKGKKGRDMGGIKTSSIATSPRDSSASSTSSSPSLYPSSYSSIHSPPLLSTNFLPSSWSPSYRSSDTHARDQLETLIARHGSPTRVSLSSLEDLTATSSTFNPPSPHRSDSPLAEAIDSLDSLTLASPVSRPIPIPKPSHHTHQDDLPVTPLTGRFDKGYYFAHRRPSSDRNGDSHPRRRSDQSSHRVRRGHTSRMRADNSSFYSPVVSPTMTPSGRSSSPQPTHPRGSSTSKSVPSFPLDSLPGSTLPSTRPRAARRSRHYTYRTPSAGSRDPVRQYREMMEGVSAYRPPSRPLSPSPSAPRLDPLCSPGPVTPLVLEDAGGYFPSGVASADPCLGNQPAGSDVLERRRAHENERTRQKARKTPKGR
ncbi:hypothetical protein P168DRAFT_296761 [Aspergillus campestris IBT 28561]|uniref:Uncharacterized protein n=1 Tax=Aspergillus campestris (strain IBT 28561) TaxID=1392248 RepID=A0A2I1D5D1_ASPC2|nr:uncharacterized protein P168DRAFT_296761 [Aspergillus campestris IBT 28561]PKY05084.1 hypothetical protein P168DRAFT_296761 [Aspergillus campestris IBT 28561]